MSDSMAKTLQELQRWGKVIVSNFKDGSWYVAVDMHVNATGVKIEITEKGETPMVSPDVVAEQCLQKVKHTVENLGKQSKTIGA